MTYPQQTGRLFSELFVAVIPAMLSKFSVNGKAARSLHVVETVTETASLVSENDEHSARTDKVY